MIAEYDKDFYVGKVLKHDDEDEFEISFMTTSAFKFKWSKLSDIIWRETIKL